jgi:hypothetical protein
MWPAGGIRGLSRTVVGLAPVVLFAQVTLTVADSAHIQLTATGPLTQSLIADLDPNYPGTGLGDWTCGPEQPLARVQPGLVLTGRWQTQPAVSVLID